MSGIFDTGLFDTGLWDGSLGAPGLTLNLCGQTIVVQETRPQALDLIDASAMQSLSLRTAVGQAITLKSCKDTLDVRVVDPVDPEVFGVRLRGGTLVQDRSGNIIRVRSA